MSKAKKILSAKVNTNSYEGRVSLVYARVSSKRQEKEGSGLGSQEERCIKYLNSVGVPHEKTYPDTYSGGDFMNRPEMREMLAYIDAHPHKKFLVVFDDLKRFARDTTFHIKLRAAFKARDVILHCLNYNFDDSPKGEFVETVFAAQGQLERQQNQRQVVQKMKARLEAGYWTFCGKKGYTCYKDDLHGKIYRPNAEGKILVEALEAFANRTLQRKIDVCRFLVEKGFWGKQSPEKYIDKMTQILADPFYAGDIEYPAWEVTRRKGYHDGIISLETYDQIQKILKKRTTTRIWKTISSDFPLRGLVVCDHCGSHLTAAWSKKVFPYYVCQTKSCVYYGKSIRKNDIEKQFAELLQKNTLKSEIGVLVDVVFERVWEQEMHYFKALELTRARERKEIEERVLQLTDAIFNAKSPQVKNVYEKQLENTAIKLENIDTESITNTDLTINYRTALNKATELLKNPYAVWKSMDIFEQHQLFFFIFDEKLPYNHLTGYRTDKIPCAIRLFEDFTKVNPLDVGIERFELSRIAPYAPEAYVYTSFTISPDLYILKWCRDEHARLPAGRQVYQFRHQGIIISIVLKYLNCKY